MPFSLCLCFVIIVAAVKVIINLKKADMFHIDIVEQTAKLALDSAALLTLP